jgi:hypothetical protein
MFHRVAYNEFLVLSKKTMPCFEHAGEEEEKAIVKLIGRIIEKEYCRNCRKRKCS